jgi:CheY-like chemotaxis protein
MKTKGHFPHLTILLADDDRDDRYFFLKALKDLSLSVRFNTVEDGEQLITYLLKNVENLPDVLFLDLNMPRKSGSECLEEIKQHPKLKSLPVVIYSTSLYGDVADLLYRNGAHYYMRKSDFNEMKQVLKRVLTLLVESKFKRPPMREFIVSMPVA